ncbi:hypothetical protein OF83DRAFT_1102246 [Amylostereum chailletii]|nr:hypothetical protein OF83DRAFT_1102246 [Amylostereum chailletii]
MSERKKPKRSHPGDEEEQATTLTYTGPLIVMWEGQGVAIVRHEKYQDVIAAVTRARGFRALGGRPFYFKAVLPNCGPGLYEVSEELWPHVVGSLRTVNLVLDTAPNSDTSDAAQRQCSSAASTTRGNRGGKVTIRVGGDVPQTFIFRVLSFNITVDSLKAKCEDKLGLSVGKFRMIYAGESLADDHTLHYYGIENESEIWLYLRQLGGKPVIYLFPPRPVEDVVVTLGLAPSWSFSAIYPTAKDVHSNDGFQTIEWTNEADRSFRISSGKRSAYSFRPFASLADDSHDDFSTSTNPTPTTDEAVPFDPAHARLSPEDSVVVDIDALPAYLDRTLKTLCLHTEARNSFITYWLPALNKHQHVALRFLPQQAYEGAAPMTVTPAPDLVTRVFMLFKGVETSDLPAWAEAVGPAHHEGYWRNIVGLDTGRWEDRRLFRVLEWGGMEV